MKSLKNIIKANLSKDSYDVIFWGHPTTQTYNDAIKTYLSSNRQDKTHLEQRAYGKLHKQKQPYTAMAILHLLDSLMQAGAGIYLTEHIPNIDLSNCNTPKQIIAEKSFYELYYKYLRLQSLKPAFLMVDKLDIDENQITYCQRAEQSISLIMQMDFLIMHCLKTSKNPIMVGMITNSILRRVKNDLAFLNRFLSENWKLILRKHQFSFHINHIYERTIFLGKNIHRIQGIAKKITFPTDFPIYRLDPQMNKAIQMEMNRRHDEKKQFVSEKMIKSSKLMDNGEIVSENSILIENDEFTQ